LKLVNPRPSFSLASFEGKCINCNTSSNEISDRYRPCKSNVVWCQRLSCSHTCTWTPPWHHRIPRHSDLDLNVTLCDSILANRKIDHEDLSHDRYDGAT
jgi:hypothetical protein